MPRTRKSRTLRSLWRVLVVFALSAGSATVVTEPATADVITPLTRVYDQVVPPGSGAPPTKESDTAAVVVTNLAVAKEICTDADCDDGPRSDTASLLTGSTAYWLITVTNTGEAGLTGITLNDQDEPSCDAEFDLAAGASASFHCSTDEVTGSVQNEATASFGMMGWPEEATTEAIAEVSVTDLHVEKEICAAWTAAECDTGPWVYSATIPKGSTAHWRITVTNTGDADLTGITLSDPTEPSCAAAPFDLAANASKAIRCSTANVKKTTTNEVTATYTPPGSPPDTAPISTAPADATARVSDLAVSKDVCQSAVPEACTETGSGPWADTHVVERGGTARWRITVTNTGEADLTGITLHDAVEPSCSTGGLDLAAGVSVAFACSTTNLTAGMTNTVTGRYVPPGAPAATPPVSTPPDSASVRVADLDVRKEVCLTENATACDNWGETATVHSGGTAHWRVTVVNTGEVDLDEVTVQDPVESGCTTTAFALASGAEKTVHCATAGLTQGVVNTVEAAYVLPGGGPSVVTGPDSASAEVAPASAPPTSPPLAVTGDDIWRLVAIGLLLAGLGVILRLWGRRRT